MAQVAWRLALFTNDSVALLAFSSRRAVEQPYVAPL